MVTSDKESKTKTVDDTFGSSNTESQQTQNKLGGPASIAVAVGVAALLLLGGTAVGFMAGHGFDRDDRGMRSGFMQSGMRSGEGIAAGESYGRMRGHMFGGTYGKVTSVSDSSITLTDDRSGGSVTFKIDDNTDVNDKNGDNAKVSDIKVGDTVAVRGTSTSDDTTADTIVIDPSRQ